MDLDLDGESGLELAPEGSRDAVPAVILISTHSLEDFQELVAGQSRPGGFLHKSALSARAIRDLLEAVSTGSRGGGGHLDPVVGSAYGREVPHQVLSGPDQHASMRGDLGRARTAHGTRSVPRPPTEWPLRPARTARPAVASTHRKAPECGTAHGTGGAEVATAELETVLRGGPFHVALRAAIAARGLPLQRVQHHLTRYGVKVGVTSLSYWQQGARRPQRPESLRAVRPWRRYSSCRTSR